MSEPGQNLSIPAGPGLPEGATIPGGELIERFSRSPGPGGQSVNTADSRVELIFAPATSTAFSVEAKKQLGRTKALRGRVRGE